MNKNRTETDQRERERKREKVQKPKRHSIKPTILFPVLTIFIITPSRKRPTSSPHGDI